ncbi:hemophore [Mycolicibacterium thermoresistibile]
MPPTRPESTVLRRGLFTAFAVTTAGAATVIGLALTTGPAATAAPDPCAASEVAKTIGRVANSTGQYLEENPETNQALTTISKQQAGPQSLGTLKAYFDANPEVAEDMQRLQQPLATLSSRCKLPITAPQLMGLMQAAQGQAAQGALPGGLPNAQNVSVPGVAAPAQSAPTGTGTGTGTGSGAGAVGSTGVGPLPGPAPRTGR